MKEIYMIINKINNKKYVGQTNQGAHKRFSQHKVADSLIGRAIRKYGEDNFEIRILEKVRVDEANAYEELHINNNNCVYPNGYNLTQQGRLVGNFALNEAYWYIGIKPRYYNVIEELNEGISLKYVTKILSKSNRNFILMKNNRKSISTWGELFEEIGCSNRVTQSEVKKIC